MGSKTRRDFLSCIGFLTEVNTDRSPFFPYHIIRSLSCCFRGDMPSLRYCFGLEATAAHDIIGIEVRLSALADRLPIDEDIEFETRVLLVRMSRCLQNRHILEQQDGILDRIDIKGKLNTLRLVSRIPVTETHRSQLAIRNGLRHTTGTGFILLTIEMDHMATTHTGGTIIHRGYDLEVIEGQCAARRRVIDITNGVIEVEIVHTELIGIVDELGDYRLEAIEVIVTLSAYDEVSLSDRNTGETGVCTGDDLRSGPFLAIIGISAYFVFGCGTLPRKRDSRTILGNDKIGRLITRGIIGDIDIINHSARLLRYRRSVSPRKSEVVLGTITVLIGDLSDALLPRSGTAEIIHTCVRLEPNDIILVLRRNCTAGGRDREDINRVTCLILFRNPEEVETIKITCDIGHNAVIEEDGIVSGLEMIERDGIIGKDPTTLITIMGRGAIIVRDIQTVMTVSIVVTRLTDIPSIIDLIQDRLFGNGVERPTCTGCFRLEITLVPSNCLCRHCQCQQGYYHYLD